MFFEGFTRDIVWWRNGVVNKIKKKYELRSQGVSIRYLIQEAMFESENPDQKYRDLLSQNDENFERVLNALDEQNQVLKVIANALYEE